MKKEVRISRAFPYYRPLSKVRKVEGTVDLLDYRFSGTVLVVKKGTRLLNVGGVEKKLDLGWVKLEKTRRRKVFDLPELVETALDGRAVWLRTRDYQDWIFAVSEQEWETHRQEVEEYLLEVGPSRGMGLPLTLGGDPEFEVVDPKSGEIIPATRVPLFVEGGLSGPMGLDKEYPIAEFRPAPAYSEEEYVRNFLTLVERVREEGVLLCTKGDLYPLGGHIHIGSPDYRIIKALKDEVQSFVRVLDDFVGRVLLPTSGKGRGGYYSLFAYKYKPYGWEYRTPPASYYADPEMIRIVFKLVRNLVGFLLIEGGITYEVLDDERAKPEEYLRFLTKEETEYFLGFPERWARGEVSPFVPMCPAVSVAAG
jgi:hypothetical protein